MTATEELRRLLDEKGVEWWEPVQVEGSAFTRWNIDGVSWTASTVHGRDNALRIAANTITPAQAIAATLGRGTCKVDGTIKWDWDRCEPYWRHELSCGHTATTLEPEPPRFCAECGSRVIGERYE